MLAATWSAVLAGTVVLLLAGCPASSDDVRPPRDQFTFPSGLALSPDESALFVSNSNSELRYDSGSVLVVDLDAVDTIIADWLTEKKMPAGCQTNALRPTLLECDESLVIDPDRGVRIGNFVTDIDVQQVAPDHLRVIAAVRGDPSITWIDYITPPGKDRAELSCAGSEEFPLCDVSNRLVSLRDDAEQSLISEPFGVHVGKAENRDFALITHLSLASVTLVDLPRADGASVDAVPAPRLTDSIVGLFAADPGTGARVAVGVAGRPSPDGTELLYVTSRSEERVRILYVGESENEAVLVPVSSFTLDGVQPSDDARGITFNEDGSRAYIVNRSPAMLHIIDTTGDPFPVNQTVGFIELCREASNVEASTQLTGRGERVYVACFLGGQVWVLDPVQGTDPIAIVEVGRGPHAMALSEDRRRLYVTNILEDTIAVIDLTPGAPTENRMVLRLGTPRQSGDE